MSTSFGEFDWIKSLIPYLHEQGAKANVVFYTKRLRSISLARHPELEKSSALSTFYLNSSNNISIIWINRFIKLMAILESKVLGKSFVVNSLVFNELVKRCLYLFVGSKEWVNTPIIFKDFNGPDILSRLLIACNENSCLILYPHCSIPIEKLKSYSHDPEQGIKDSVQANAKQYRFCITQTAKDFNNLNLKDKGLYKSIPVGYPTYFFSKTRRNNLCEKDISPKKRVKTVLLFCRPADCESHISYDLKEELVSQFFIACSEIKEVAIRIKLTIHPRDPDQNGHEVINLARKHGISITVTRGEIIKEILDSDIVVSQHSSIILDSVAYYKPTVYLWYMRKKSKKGLLFPEGRSSSFYSQYKLEPVHKAKDIQKLMAKHLTNSELTHPSVEILEQDILNTENSLKKLTCLMKSISNYRE